MPQNWMLACEASLLRHAAQDPQVQHRLLDTTRIANAFVDEMLRIFRLNTVLMERLTPLRIPGELRFPGGRVHDVRVMKLPALERRGDVSASLEAGVFAVSGGLGLDELLVQSRYSVGPREPFQVAGDIDSRIRNTTARVQLAIDVARARAVMDVFKFSDMGDVQVTRMTGLPPALNWLGVAIMNGILKDQADTLRQKLEDEAKAALNESLEKTKIPITIN